MYSLHGPPEPDDRITATSVDITKAPTGRFPAAHDESDDPVPYTKHDARFTVFRQFNEVLPAFHICAIAVMNDASNLCIMACLEF